MRGIKNCRKPKAVREAVKRREKKGDSKMQEIRNAAQNANYMQIVVQSIKRERT